MEGQEEQKARHIENHFEAGSNCQVFQGNMYGCVFAMPGSTVNNTVAPPPELNDKEEEVLEKIKCCFWGNEMKTNEAVARDFLLEIRGLKDVGITAVVNRFKKEKKITDMCKKIELYTPLHDAGIYTATPSNWNNQVNF